MRVLLTGAFGNLGQSTLRALKNSEHEITCFDIPTYKNKRLFKKLSKKQNLSIIWGTVLDKEIVAKIVKEYDCIIHLAGLTPPLTEQLPRFSYQVNVQGTKNIIEPLSNLDNPPKIIFPSSVSIYGPIPPNAPLLTSKQQVNPTDIYTRTKFEVEELLKESNLSWFILRMTAVPGLDFKSNNKMELLYEMPLEQKVEFLHTFDAGLAIANAVDLKISNKILLIGGGKKNQMINRDFLGKYFRVIGLGKLPEKIFKKPQIDKDWFYTHWMDTKESQKLLKYQQHTFEDFLRDFKKGKQIFITFVYLLRPFVKLMIIRNSPYPKK